MAKTVKKKISAKLPVPVNIPAPKIRLSKAVRRAEAAHLQPLQLPETGDAAVLDRLWATIEQRRLAGDAVMSHSARLIARGTQKVAQKLGEEAVELVIEAVARMGLPNQEELIRIVAAGSQRELVRERLGQEF